MSTEGVSRKESDEYRSEGGGAIRGRSGWKVKGASGNAKDWCKERGEYGSGNRGDDRSGRVIGSEGEAEGRELDGRRVRRVRAGRKAGEYESGSHGVIRRAAGDRKQVSIEGESRRESTRNRRREPEIRDRVLKE